MSVNMLTQTELLTDFLDVHKIKWVPITLLIKNGKKTPIGPMLDTGNIPRTSDFPNWSLADCKKYQDMYKGKCKHIAIDTRKVQQFDIDEPTFSLKDTELSGLGDCPYFLSSVKQLPHYFVKMESTVESTPLKIGDLLTGMWSWANIDSKIVQATNAIKTLKFKEIPSSWKNETFSEAKMIKMIKSLEERSVIEREWIETCLAIFNVAWQNKKTYEKEPAFYVHEFSRQCPAKYNDKAIKRINDLTYQWNGLGLGSLKKWAEEAEGSKKRRRAMQI